MLSLSILNLKCSYQHERSKRPLSEIRRDLLQEIYKFKKQHKIKSDEESRVRLDNLAVSSGVKNEADMILEDLENEP